ncbi:unnamed protein product [Closterium sp. Yama58-4]|nr:unnamed protein product [Closterium sp. Yama58-4]
MSHSKQPRNQGKRKDGKNRPRGGARGGAESSIGDPFALSEERLSLLDLEGGLNQRAVAPLLPRSASHCQPPLHGRRSAQVCSAPAHPGVSGGAATMVALLPTSQTCSITSTLPLLPPLPPLPSDILHLLFSHLDPLSLARASAVCSHWRDIAAAAEPDWVTHLAACLGSVPAAEAQESRGGKGRFGGEVQERQTPLWQELVSRCAQGSTLSSLQSNRVLCKECSMVAWTPNSAPTPPPQATTPSTPLDAPSLATATLSFSQFSRGKNKGRGGIATLGNNSTGMGVGAVASGRGTGTGASRVASVPGGSSAAAGRACKAGCEAVDGRDAVDGTTRRGYHLQQHAWKLAGTIKVVASLSDEFEGEESSDEDGEGGGRAGYHHHSNGSSMSRFW